MIIFGLIGYPLSHSFSEKYFTQKFKKENIDDAEYNLFPIKNISEFPLLLKKHPELCGLNVTIPYKEVIIPFLDELDETAKAIGAVNCVKLSTKYKAQSTKLIGFNTDVFGFRESLKPILKREHERALILGTGGAAKAVEYVLKNIGVECYFVSRHKTQDTRHKTFVYDELNKNSIEHFKLIINASPVGMYPEINQSPAIPYEYLTSEHLLYDLIYNPEETLFLKKGKEKGAQTQNGLTMLKQQAEKSWEIWNG